MENSRAKYITVDGDDVGQKIASAYIKNDSSELVRINELVCEATIKISDFLTVHGFVILFCAADGVAGFCNEKAPSDEFIFESIKSLVGSELKFSAGVGKDLRESYVALLSAKSSGKGRLHNFEKLDLYV